MLYAYIFSEMRKESFEGLERNFFSFQTQSIDKIWHTDTANLYFEVSM